MFTGLVEERGRVAALEPRASGMRLEIACRSGDAGSPLGASLAVNGVCLTVVERAPGRLAFDVAPETLERTTLGSLSPEDPVNLETPLTLASPLGGHLVQGHVDGVGRVEHVDRDERGATLRIAPPQTLARYIVEKGSVAVDGVSLTVASTDDEGFTVALVPHTLEVTTLGARRAGDHVNLEVDIVAKYVESLVRGDR